MQVVLLKVGIDTGCGGMHSPLFADGRSSSFQYRIFSQETATTEGALGKSLGQRLFTSRLELVGELDHESDEKDRSPAEKELRQEVAATLRKEVAAMNVDNFVVRPKRRLVEKYAQPEAWETLPPEAAAELAREVAGLPSEIEAEDEEAKRFDLLMLRLQLAVLRVEPAYTRLSEQVREIAGLLEEKSGIPMVHQQMPLIQDLQTDEWWQDVTVPMLEVVRRRLRALVKLIEKRKRKPVYTDFEDDLGGETRALPD